MTPQELRETVYKFQTSRIILTALELGIFTALGDKEKTSGEVSKTISTDLRATDRLMNSLCIMKLLLKKDGKFSNTSFSSQYLVQGNPDYISNLLHAVNLWDSWSNLTDVVRNGKPAGRTGSNRNDWLENFIEAMHYRALDQAPEDISYLDLAGVQNVLDVGGGSAAFSMEFVKIKKEITATVFDLPEVIPLTQKYISNAGLSEKIRTIKGNYLFDDLGSGYDIIFLSAIVHSNSFEDNTKLIQKCANSLNEKGQLVIQDYAMNEERTFPPGGTFFAINMLVNTQGGDTFTQSEIYSWLTSAGLKELRSRETSHGATQITGRKL